VARVSEGGLKNPLRPHTGTGHLSGPSRLLGMQKLLVRCRFSGWLKKVSGFWDRKSFFNRRRWGRFTRRRYDRFNEPQRRSALQQAPQRGRVAERAVRDEAPRERGRHPSVPSSSGKSLNTSTQCPGQHRHDPSVPSSSGKSLNWATRVSAPGSRAFSPLIIGEVARQHPSGSQSWRGFPAGV
jgi:hypothetical protein